MIDLPTSAVSSFPTAPSCDNHDMGLDTGNRIPIFRRSDIGSRTNSSRSRIFSYIFELYTIFGLTRLEIFVQYVVNPLYGEWTEVDPPNCPRTRQNGQIRVQIRCTDVQTSDIAGLSRTTAISRERPRPSNNGRRANDRSELLGEISALKAEKAELVAAHATEKVAMAEENRQLRQLIVALEQRVGELERSSNLSAATAASLRRATDSRNRLPTRKRRNASTACAASRSANPAASPDIRGRQCVGRRIRTASSISSRRPAIPATRSSRRARNRRTMSRRQVHDTPVPKIEVKEYRAHLRRCECGKIVTAQVASELSFWQAGTALSLISA